MRGAHGHNYRNVAGMRWLEFFNLGSKSSEQSSFVLYCLCRTFLHERWWNMISNWCSKWRNSLLSPVVNLNKNEGLFTCHGEPSSQSGSDLHIISFDWMVVGQYLCFMFLFAPLLVTCLNPNHVGIVQFFSTLQTSSDQIVRFQTQAYGFIHLDYHMWHYTGHVPIKFPEKSLQV